MCDHAICGGHGTGAGFLQHLALDPPLLPLLSESKPDSSERDSPPAAGMSQGVAAAGPGALSAQPLPRPRV